MSEFGDAFKKARQSGQATFEYNGKKYGTRLAGESKEAHAKYLSSKSGGSTPAPKAVKKEEKVDLPAKKAPSVVAEKKAAPAKPAAKKTSGVSETRKNEEFIQGMKEEATARQASRDNAKKSSEEVSKFVPSKPKAVVKEDMRESYKKERSTRGRKESAKDYERFKAMKEYAAGRKKASAFANKYVSILDRAGKLFKGGGKMTKYLKGGQMKLDVNKDGKISGEDFKMLRKK